MRLTRLIVAMVGLFLVQNAAFAGFKQGEAVQIFDTETIEGGPYYVNDHTLIQAPDGRWHLFGIFHKEPFGEDSEFDFIHAVSDGKSMRMTAAPAPYTFALRADRKLGENHIWAPHVVRDGNRYVMVFHSGASDNHKSRISIAESKDLYEWKRVGEGPLFEDICMARDPMLLPIKEKKKEGPALWALYYTRCDSLENERSGVAYRTSTDLKNWSEPRMALVLPITEGRFNSAYTESPFVFERDGWYYLSVTSYPVSWVSTFVFRSRNPFHFDSHPVAELNAHAAEWAFDRDGKTWLTHCGAGQRGVWWLPIEWTSFQESRRLVAEKTKTSR